MIISRTWLNVWRPVVGALLTLATAGCAWATHTHPHEHPQEQQQEMPRATPEMPEPFDNMGPGEFRAYIDTSTLDFLGSHGVTKPRRCAPGSGTDCPADGSGTTLVRIRPESGANLLAPTAVTANGHIIAELKNIGQGDEDVYHIPKGRERVFWLVEKDGSGAKARFIILRLNGMTEVLGGRSYPYEDCQHLPKQPGRPLEADFKACNARDSGAPFVFANDEEAWISCFAGCCVAQL